jgi:YYY domain-containing protein
VLLPILSWWCVVQLIGLCSLPLCTHVFRMLPLRGYPFSKTLGLLLSGYGAWLLCMLGLAPFQAGTLVAILILIAGAGIWLIRRELLRDTLRSALRSHWPMVAFYEIILAAAMLFSLWLRWGAAWGPGIGSTEKPMDMTLLVGILTSPTFPPGDPWLAGYSINYYYLGYLFIAALTRLSGADLGDAFNLGLATIFGLTALMIAGLLIAMVKSAHAQSSRLAQICVALAGLLLVLGMGNQYGALQKLAGTPLVLPLDQSQLTQALLQRSENLPTLQITPPFRASEFGVISILRPDPAARFDWWLPSRGVWDDLPDRVEEDVEVQPDVFERREILQRRYAITEVPIFSFYLGDMHPHVLVLPFALLALALTLAVLLDPAPPTALLQREHLAGMLVTSLTLGCLYPINSWDAPTYTLLYVGALALRFRRWAVQNDTIAGSDSAYWRFYGRIVTQVGIIAAFLIVPFLLTFRSLAGNQAPAPALAGIPLLRNLSSMLAPVPDHTDLHEFIAIFGLFAAILLAYLICIRPQTMSASESSASLVTGYPPWLWGIIAGIAALGFLIGMPLLALLPLAALLADLAWRHTETPVASFMYWAIGVGALVVFATDIVYIRDHFGSRMNTIFKFYYQVWLLWGTLAAFALWAILRELSRRRLLALWLLPIGILLVGAGVYPWALLTETRTDAPPSINALAFLDTYVQDEAAAIAWVRKHTQPNDIVLTAVGGAYDETGRIATVTGRPTLLGWNGSHERFWRSGSPDILEEINNRERDIPLIYAAGTPAEERQRLLEHYTIAYVYVGPIERTRYGDPAFSQLPSLELVFEQNGVQLYKRR